MLEPLRTLGHEVVWAADFSNFIGDKTQIPCITEQIDINTNPLKPSNRKALKQLCDIIEKYNIQAIQSSTPIGGLLGRFAGRKMRVNPIIYAAHGFLFFKGAPLINRTVYRIRNVEALISCACVFKEYRGKSIANRMLGKVVELLWDEGGTEMALGVRTDNKTAIRAYEKASFKVTDEKTYLRILRKNFPYHVV